MTATIIDTLPDGRGGRGNGRKYPWDEWTDGQIRAVLQGEDYDCAHITLVNCVRVKARQLGVSSSTRKLIRGGIQVGWAIQFHRNGSTP